MHDDQPPVLDKICKSNRLYYQLYVHRDLDYIDPTSLRSSLKSIESSEFMSSLIIGRDCVACGYEPCN